MVDRHDFSVPGEGPSSSGAGRFHFFQANRDPQSNWEVDLAKNLEEYLFKICSGEATDHDHAAHSVNFAEAALLIQGSIQVYSKKVEYLYSLVVQALEFLSQKRQEQPEGVSIKHDEGESTRVVEENEPFLGLDDVPVEPKNCLDSSSNENDISNKLLKPPANLLVLEGDCLDTGGDGGELDSFLLVTCDFFEDFLLLDPCDAAAVHDYLNSDDATKEHLTNSYFASPRSKSRHNIFCSPSRRSGGIDNKPLPSKVADANMNGTLDDNNIPEYGNCSTWSQSYADYCTYDDGNWHGEEPDIGCSDVNDDSDSDDPWKPLNPHEPGTLKIKPFKKGKTYGRQVRRTTRWRTTTSEFPIAKLEGISKARHNAGERLDEPYSPPYFEKLRQLQEKKLSSDADYAEDENYDDAGEPDLPDIDQDDFDLPNCSYEAEADISLNSGKRKDNGNQDRSKASVEDDLDPNASLEDLCRSHLDSLLASIAETEKQTELATRVSTWKQRVESNLEKQDSHPPFDIHQYGERILDKLSLDADSQGSMSFTDVVAGQPKHDVARTFSALLQLVNNRDVDLERPNSTGQVVCYTATNPFKVKLLSKKGKVKMEFLRTQNSVRSPLKKRQKKSNTSADASSPLISPHQNGRRRARLSDDSLDFRSCG